METRKTAAIGRVLTVYVRPFIETYEGMPSNIGANTYATWIKYKDCDAPWAKEATIVWQSVPTSLVALLPAYVEISFFGDLPFINQKIRVAQLTLEKIGANPLLVNFLHIVVVHHSDVNI